MSGVPTEQTLNVALALVWMTTSVPQRRERPQLFVLTAVIRPTAMLLAMVGSRTRSTAGNTGIATSGSVSC